ncbi:MAG TPA: hypothetical protein VHX61_03440 [Rhizomicrobium sp.]|nr:hypothetical protein [Rhizomicrobium sp.]
MRKILRRLFEQPCELNVRFVDVSASAKGPLALLTLVILVCLICHPFR